MIIIVEGIDRVGKTTLCNKLSEKLNINIYKHNNDAIDYHKMDNNNETDKMLQVLDICKISNASLIFDRFHFSDFVYGILERKYDCKNAVMNFNKINDKLKSLNAIVIVVKPTDISASSKQHGSDLYVYNTLIEYCMNNCDIKDLYLCDYNSIDEVVKEIYESI